MTLKIHTEDTFLAVCDSAKMAKKIIMCVAFWGKGATERLKLYDIDPSKITIICDLRSGSCSFEEIEKILKLEIQIKTLDRLHAKIYWTDKSAVIGSANASANGLGMENSEQLMNYEACIETDDAKIVSEIKNWIDCKILPRSEEVNLSNLLEFKVNNNTRKKRPSYSKSIFNLIDNPENFEDRDWYVYSYDQIEISKRGQEETDNIKNKYGNDFDSWEYDDGKSSAGRIVIDQIRHDNKFQPATIWRHADLKPIKVGNKKWIHAAHKLKNIEGISLDKESRKIIKHFLEEKYRNKKEKYWIEEYSLLDISKWYINNNNR